MGGARRHNSSQVLPKLLYSIATCKVSELENNGIQFIFPFDFIKSCLLPLHAPSHSYHCSLRLLPQILSTHSGRTRNQRNVSASREIRICVFDTEEGHKGRAKRVSCGTRDWCCDGEGVEVWGFCAERRGKDGVEVFCRVWEECGCCEEFGGFYAFFCRSGFGSPEGVKGNCVRADFKADG
ncbi:unnamed protein product [Moneuplotes crassus]|uniref:Uncharacterized protein n=1 Tax=Euplotes crassus TaxID=5936 RepID=A0AAD1XLR8_EUPCR|nr:unnamed protein product [Moneuplotes crassus]